MDMKRVAALTGLVAVTLVTAPILGQSRRFEPNVDLRIDMFRGAGAHIGASVRDLEGSETKAGTGVFVEQVQTEGPAAKAGLQPADIVTRFDGETVRSVRQFSRLVQETPAGRTVRATVLRDGRTTELSVTPEAGAAARVLMDGGFLRRRGLDFDLDFDFNLDLPIVGRSRLGVSVEELTPQLAAYFGAKDGVLVASVTEDSPASRAGLKAGDVIASVNGQTVTSASDLVRELRRVSADTDVTIGIVRDKQETTVKARLEEGRVGRPIRSIRSIRARQA
jgi:serine protease Do